MKTSLDIFPPKYACGETIDRWPILDWDGFIAIKLSEYHFRKFTGEIYNCARFSFYLFRFKLSIYIEWGRKYVGEEEAKRLHRMRKK